MIHLLRALRRRRRAEARRRGANRSDPKGRFGGNSPRFPSQKCRAANGGECDLSLLLASILSGFYPSNASAAFSSPVVCLFTRARHSGCHKLVSVSKFRDALQPRILLARARSLHSHARKGPFFCGDRCLRCGAGETQASVPASAIGMEPSLAADRLPLDGMNPG
eukprot:scaffold7468_cov277-Pinguiococcus_pyrenoidosus.AAC.4